MLPRPRTVASILMAVLLVAGPPGASLPDATPRDCDDPGPLETRPARCSHIEWHIVRFELQTEESIRLQAELIAQTAAHWAFYWSRWSGEDGLRISTEYGTPRTAHTNIGAGATNLTTGMNTSEAGLQVHNTTRYWEQEFRFHPGEQPTQHIWLIGAGSDRPIDLQLDFMIEPANLTIESGTRGHFRPVSAFDDGIVLHAGGLRPPGAPLASIAFAAGATQSIALTEQTHGAFGLTGHEIEYRIEHGQHERANGTLQNGRVDIQLFDLDPGPWNFTVDRLAGAATPQGVTTPGSGSLLLLEPSPAVRYPQDLQDLVFEQIQHYETLINP